MKPEAAAAHPPAIWEAFARASAWKDWVLVLQLAVIAMLVLAGIRISSRPPDVVLVDSTGASTYVPRSVASEKLLGWVAEQRGRPSDATVVHFAKDFLRRALAVDSDMVDSTWKEALDLMSPEMRAQLSKDGHITGMLAQVRAARVRTSVLYDDMVLLDRTQDRLQLKAQLRRTRRSLVSDQIPETQDRISVELVLNVVPRSAVHPDGLEVASWTLREQKQPTTEAAHAP